MKNGVYPKESTLAYCPKIGVHSVSRAYGAHIFSYLLIPLNPHIPLLFLGASPRSLRPPR